MLPTLGLSGWKVEVPSAWPPGPSVLPVATQWEGGGAGMIPTQPDVLGTLAGCFFLGGLTVQVVAHFPRGTPSVWNC